jgi:predicted ATPase
MDAPLPSYHIHNVPSQPTSFFGRHGEISEIVERLIDPTCRLLTLTGPGGIGKTRLAIQVATELLDTFAHGVWFVPLQHIRSAEFLAIAVADALAVPLSTTNEPTAQLRTYLSDKSLVLILDNFEHLISQDGAELLSDLLHTAPALKLIVTSREALALLEE